jgi:hypothetical protein
MAEQQQGNDTVVENTVDLSGWRAGAPGATQTETDAVVDDAVAISRESRIAERLEQEQKHLADVYAALDVPWGQDPFARIAELKGEAARGDGAERAILDAYNQGFNDGVRFDDLPGSARGLIVRALVREDEWLTKRRKDLSDGGLKAGVAEIDQHLSIIGMVKRQLSAQLGIFDAEPTPIEREIGRESASFKDTDALKDGDPTRAGGKVKDASYDGVMSGKARKRGARAAKSTTKRETKRGGAPEPVGRIARRAVAALRPKPSARKKSVGRGKRGR